MGVEVGKVYMIRGGLILRYAGPWWDEEERRKMGREPGPGLRFERVSEPGTSWYSAAIEDVLYEITPDKLPMIQFRREQLLARDLFTEVADMDVLIAELQKAVS